REAERAVPQAPRPAAADAFQPQSTLFRQPQEPAPVAARAPAPAPRPVQPAPAPVREVQPQASAPRMPRVEDFPPVVKAEIESNAHPQHEQEDRGPMGLIKRLTHGLSRRDGDQGYAEQPREPKLRQAAPQPRRMPESEAQLYAPRQGQLDEHGRLTTQPRAVQDDDHLEIPAFLRRQAN
ncbi:cell division protein FtsZ, partial [Nitratireductor sp. ZSWI3]|nr:cell division protein FtsZ [Nitratireductor sp. ZSWI3]